MWLILILAFFYLLVFVSWCLFKSVRTFAKKLRPLLNLLSIMAAIFLFVQLYVTIDLFNKARKLEHEDKVKQFEARVDTLDIELRGNLEVCKFIFENQEDIDKGIRLPQNFFYFPMLEGCLRSGEIVAKDLLVDLYSAYHYMILAQNIMDRTVALEHLKVLVNPDDAILRRSIKLNKEQMGFLINNTTLVRGYIESSLNKLPNYRNEFVNRLRLNK
ncbi:MAG: hypothetical protein NTV82_02880 [Candidatus Aminicenantes bacterium]|nr:hypothetical protein [Candidatus Aminicenantes bacterium]